MPDLELSVTICSWNTESDLRLCLQSLEAIQDEAHFEVLVCDNNSEDPSPDMVEAEFPWVRLYRMSRNLGFTGGHNMLLEQIKAPHALLLNSDTIVHPGAFRTLLDYAANNPNAGIIGPKLLNSDGSLQFSSRRFPNPIAALFRNTPVGRLFPNNRFTREYLMQDWDHSQPRMVDWVSGAAMFVSKDLMAKTGFLDPKFFMYCEDVDWCWRAHKAGFDVIYFPTSVITHAIGRSTDKAPNRMIGTFHRAMLRFYTKNVVAEMPIFVRPFAVAFAATALALRASMFIAKNRLDDIRRKRSR